MSIFEPNKRHLRELLMYFFNLKKSAAEAHRFLVETYGEAVLSERSCREWFQKFKNGEFDIEDKELSERPKVYEDAELEALLGQDSRQTQEEPARTLGVTQQGISYRLIINAQFLIKNGGNLFVHLIIFKKFIYGVEKRSLQIPLLLVLVIILDWRIYK